MLSVFLILSFLIFSNAFYVKSASFLKKTKLYCNKHNIKKAIQIFNIIDIIQPSSISKFIQYKLFFRNAYNIFIHNFKEDFYEMYIHFDMNLFVFTLFGVFLFYLYINNSEKLNKISSFKKEEETEIC
jgi:hypothetical protein